jgi:Cof subfamily protein (haloacid dehalogenase superfamily)
VAADPALPDGFDRGGRFARWDPRPTTYVVADVDGTLVGPSGVPSDAVAAAAARAAAAGVRVGFATGRMRLAVGPLWDHLQLPGPHVLHNGAEVRAEGRTIASWPVPDEGVAAVLELADTLDLYVELYVEDGFVVSRWDERARPHWDLLGHEPLGVVVDPDELDGQPVLKATFGVFDPDDVAPLVDALHGAGLAAGPAGSPVTPQITYVNATDARVDKGAALAAAAGHLDVPLASVVAVGDAANDAPMLAIAGTAVAMGQADDALKEVAHLVAPAVDADGVATLLDAAVGWARDG